MRNRHSRLSLVCILFAAALWGCSGDGAGDEPDAGNNGDAAGIHCEPTATIISVQASDAVEGHGADFTLDGVFDDTSYWAALGDGQWITYGLSNRAEIQYVRFAFHETSIRYFDVLASDDGVEWTDVLTNQGSQGDNANAFERFDFTPTCAQYLRFVGHGSDESGSDGWNAVVETDINGFAVDLTGARCGDNDCQSSETCSSCPADCGACGTHPIHTIFSLDFELNTLSSPYLWSEWSSDWNVTWADGQDITDIVSFGGSQVVRAFYQNGQFGPDQINDGVVNGTGINIMSPLSGNHTELYLTYNVWFEDGWTWAKGSKMPGFNAGEFDVSAPEDYDPSWGAGLGCQTHGLQGWGIPGHILGYVYHHDKVSSEYGEAFGTGVALAVDRWTNITVRVVLNTTDGIFGDYNGIIEIFVDGVFVGGRSNYRFRNRADIYLDTLKFYTFMGGNDATYASDHDQYNYWDDVVVFTYQDVAENADIPRGNVASSAGRVLSLPNWPK